MKPAPLIRQATLADLPAIWAIETSSFPTPWSRWSFLAELSNPVSITLVAGPPAPHPWETWGYIIFWIVADEMHILNLAVHSEHRRQGLARTLLRDAMARARSREVNTAWLEVRPSNLAARALYDQFGFEEMGVRPRYYADTQEDALLLAFSWEEEDGDQL